MLNFAWVRDQWLSIHDEQTFRYMSANGMRTIACGTEVPPFATPTMDQFIYENAEQVMRFADVIDLPGFEYDFALDFLGLHDNIFMTSFDNIPYGKAGDRPAKYHDRVRGVIARTQMIKETLIRDGVPASKINVVYPGVDIREFKDDGQENYKSVLFVGRLVPEKGLYDLVIAMQGIDAQLVVAGQGDIDPYLSLARKLHVDLRYLGNVHHNQMAEIMNSAGMLVVPSIPTISNDPFASWIEQFGMVIIEAKACGLPIVATDIGSIPEIIRHGIDGYMVPARSWHKLHSAISVMIEERDTAIKMGEQGRLDVEARFDSRKTAEQLVEIYSR